MLSVVLGSVFRGLWRGLAGTATRMECCIGFLRAERGVAATEFALILPVMILLYAGAGEVSQAVMTSRRVESLSRTLADLVAQQQTSGQSSSAAAANPMGERTLQDIMMASTAIMAPSPLTTLTMTVSAVDTVNNALGICCVFKVRWSYTQSGSLRPCNVNLTPVPPTQSPSPSTISSAMIPPFAGLPLPNPIPLLIADVSMGYTGPFSKQLISFPVSMGRTSYMMPRTPGQVMLGSATGSSNQKGAICY